MARRTEKRVPGKPAIPPDAEERLRAGCSRAADPERARWLAGEVLEEVAQSCPDDLAELWSTRAGVLCEFLCMLLGAAPFFAPILRKHPRWCIDFGREDFRVPRRADSYRTRLARWIEKGSGAALPTLLREFKYFELARITYRDLCPERYGPQHTAEILQELSHLADALLGVALQVALRRTAERLGPPVWSLDGGEVLLGFCVLGLGKLGSEELNYSSDVDLIYVYDLPAEAAESALVPVAGSLSPSEYFTHIALDFGRIVTESTADGFLYRIDLDLRPEGRSGPLVVSADALTAYYEQWAATWEKAAFMKARPVAGDENLGWRVIRAIDPLIYRAAIDFSGVAAIRAMKQKIASVKGRDEPGFNLKTGSGGIRDVEFVAQALQMLHGGRIPQVRGRSTQAVLQALEQVGVLPYDDATALLQAYSFLRRVENRLQMEMERQTHRLPRDESRLRRLARSMGFAGDDEIDRFEAALETHRAHVRRVFTELLPEHGTERILDLFTRNVPQLVANSTTRRMIEELASRFAHEIDHSVDAERALNNLDRFIHGVGSRRFYYELLLDRPELVPRLTGLFAASEYLSAYFARHPRLIEPIFSDPNVLVLSRDELRREFVALREDLARASEAEAIEISLDALRLFHNRNLINIGLLDLSGKIERGTAEAALTDLAEVCIEIALDLASSEMRVRQDEAKALAAKFLVVGMGKLATHEITYGSDLDLIFLYEVGRDLELEAQEFFVRLAQKLIWALRTRTREGFCYEIDTRLRPSGNQGMLVTSLSSFERYHCESAQVWEKQALLRARAVAGNERLAGRFEALRRKILARPVGADLRADIHRIRERMEKELAPKREARRDFKTGRGGLLDVESVVQYLQLSYGAAHPELFNPDPISTQIVRLRALGLLEENEARTLESGWDFLQRLSSRLRIVENRSISDLDERRADIEALARQLGYTSSQREGGARRALLEDYVRHTAAIRTVYDRILRGQPRELSRNGPSA